MWHLEHQPTALVVEDHEHLSYLLSYMLRREGFKVAAATNGREAVAYITENRAVSIVLMDLMLPYLNGYELIGLIRSHPDWKQVPIVVLSARTQEDDIVAALRAGANDYVRKPYQPRELLARIRRHITDSNESLEPAL